MPIRQTKQREAIYETVKNTKCHPDAEWIYTQVRQRLPNVSLGTVYRNLRELACRGELLTLETEFGKIHYDGDTSEHAHFICKNCGEIFDLFVKSEVGGQLIQMGFMPDCEKTVFYGLCPHCTQAQQGVADSPQKD